MTLNVSALRDAFPILHQEANGKPLVYLDNAATTQKPRVVIDAIRDYYQGTNSNVHRGAHYLSDRATADFEAARDTVAAFLNADREEIIWTKGTTEGINLVAQCIGRERLKAGDEVLITTLEHHANIVPWQQACLATGASLKVVPLREDGSVDSEAFHQLLNERTRIVALSHVSNSLGSVTPVAELIAAAKAAGAITLVDGAQAVSHFPVDVRALGCDFYAFSGHKVFGPTGIGALYGRRELLEAMPPYQTGGEMIEVVTFEKSTWNQLPYKFEPGTPNIAGVVGLGAAIRWLQGQDRDALARHERALLSAAHEQAEAFPGLKIIGNAATKASVLSFLLDGAHPADVGVLLDKQGVAVRTGHHCCMPLMDSLGIPGTVRASFSIYNTLDEVDVLFQALHKVRSFL
ncbi:aminotransferase class V-fold PLP-dependent enzyme [Alloalcanivorax xenomutans]|jgi:cysteine desulfurase / selenocysteine lyase|uniref:aminotransferase class V-fold PLP-dependent enzyme n=1 Tax=Alloalcanivorax xenomutans TaxID=1094342 RepID=UPI0003B83BF9|nr:cysteine desulfurase [Alloalcanivorax xenomutans]ERS13514.1 cysteine desulfurase [Alcanivorax sp. PN-3]KYZ84886.1 cysteine sulfinate desulfinase [Alcanivorax sp. KX64203]PHS55735.1 MAG: cysteine desulfurase [Alcanivorax sp.]WOA32621.1 cysteine desulfurase [Alloalcanivorax xenomutans]CUR47487.1 Cysteine desulfurase, SufS subfamily [Alloalcanivorax xenomutans]